MTGIFDEMKCQNIVDIVKQLSQLNTEEHQNNNYNGVEGHKELLTCNSTINYLIFTMNVYVHAHVCVCVCMCMCVRMCVRVCVHVCEHAWMGACMHACVSLFSYLCMYPLHKQMKNFRGTRTRVLGYTQPVLQTPERKFNLNILTNFLIIMDTWNKTTFPRNIPVPLKNRNRMETIIMGSFKIASLTSINPKWVNFTWTYLTWPEI